MQNVVQFSLAELNECQEYGYIMSYSNEGSGTFSSLVGGKNGTSQLDCEYDEFMRSSRSTRANKCNNNTPQGTGYWLYERFSVESVTYELVLKD